GLDPRHREVAARLGYAACYALPLAAERSGRLGAAVWLYDEPAEPLERQRHLVGLYARYAGEHLARLVEVERTRACLTTVGLELLLRLTEPARSATALFAYCEPSLRKITLAGAGHSPPLLIGERRTEFVETSVSAPLGMLACWEAPSMEFQAERGETVLLYTD